MKRRLFVFGLAVSVLALAGCGGGGSVASPSAGTRVTKQEIVTAVEQGFASKQQGAASAGTVRITRAERPAFYDAFHQVWSVSLVDEASGSFGEDYFVDEALTIPAGKARSFFTTGDDGSVIRGQTVEVTAGPLKGYTATTNATGDSGGLRYDFQGVHPLYGPFKTTGVYVAATNLYTLQNRFGDAQGNARFYDIEYTGDGGSKVRYNSDTLFNFELNYTSTGAGTGTVTGSSELLPATITWDQQGSGTITFKDGSTQRFTDFRFDI